MKYQRWQSEASHGPRMIKYDYVISFIGDGKGRARFQGVFKQSREPALVDYTDLPIVECWPWRESSYYYLNLEPMNQYNKAVGKLVIEWKGEVNWVQPMKDYQVLET
ncbi:MAG: hypothetical protein CMJ78_01515 [Planctomycetaceae bacterium]|nr:hypothetical protein [Planctomycetaceae bacterium]